MLSYGALGAALTAIPWSRWRLAVRLWTASLPAYEVLEMRTAASPARARGSDPVTGGPAGDGGHRFRTALQAVASTA